MLYAIGEILILIIGIVFALKVNNWNHDQQNKASEIVILKSIKSELENDLASFSIDVGVHRSQIRSSQIVLDHFENNLPYNDSLSRHFLETCNYTIVNNNKGSFETLKSLGVGMISNTELRKDIIYLYDAQYGFLNRMAMGLANNMEYAGKNIFNSRFYETENYYMELGENLEAVEFIGNMIPLDFERLKNDSEYIYFLKTTKNKHKIYLDILNDIKNEISKVVLNIEEELIELEK